jgi:hypothetical protein
MLLAAGGRAAGAALGLLSVDDAIPNGTRVESGPSGAWHVEEVT